MTTITRITPGAAKFLYLLERGDRLGARREIENLVAKTASGHADNTNRVLWGNLLDIPEHQRRTAIGIILELLRLRTRRWPTFGAIEQIAGIMAEEESSRTKIMIDSERRRAEVFLLEYILVHPRDNRGSRAALVALSRDLVSHRFYRRALSIYAKSRILSRANREEFARLIPPRQRR